MKKIINKKILTIFLVILLGFSLFSFVAGKEKLESLPIKEKIISFFQNFGEKIITWWQNKAKITLLEFWDNIINLLNKEIVIK